ncbi:hypothetical protein EDB92DRAFT_595532 [Lactarius akahatsu]|uniref:Uncharacterized protein n=1 Tax=Lactarius akahatsu TaxID=416441 RepID=A0AAD4Q7I5_9AGAM|nr:hypothetical protein EDB92DRAFT_595532 [Lactarius akahatsu]
MPWAWHTAMWATAPSLEVTAYISVRASYIDELQHMWSVGPISVALYAHPARKAVRRIAEEGPLPMRCNVYGMCQYRGALLRSAGSKHLLKYRLYQREGLRFPAGHQEFESRADPALVKR